MSDFSGKDVKHLREAYASIYSQTDENEVISEEKIFEAFVEEFTNDLFTYLSEEGMLKDDVILAEGEKTKAFMGALSWVGKKLGDITGFGRAKTRIPVSQRVQGGPTTQINPGGAGGDTRGAFRRQATAAAGGSAATVMAGTPEGQEALRRAGQGITGALGGGYKGLTTPSGVPYIDPSDRNSSGKSGQTTPVLPDGFELGPNGEVRRKK